MIGVTCLNRTILSIVSFFIRSGEKRALFFKKKKVFYHIGENVMIQSWKVPLCAELISIGNNVRIASNVTFCTHDVIHKMLNNLDSSNRYKEMMGCIELGDNIFIGANSVILYNVKIGSNIIIASGSVVSKDLEDGFVYAGVPAKKIGTFKEFCEKRRKYSEKLNDKNISKVEFEKCLWEIFENSRK